jgi:hypothetical protein
MQPAVGQMQAAASRSTVRNGEVGMWILVFAASLALAVVRPLTAQFPTDVAVGSRVRVVLPDTLRQNWGPRVQWLQGGVAGISNDTLYLRVHGTPSTLAIPRSSIRRLDRSRGVASPGESAIRGALFGAFWLGVLSLTGEGSDAAWDDDLAAKAAIGAGIGFVFGAIFPSERWRRVRLSR